MLNYTKKMLKRSVRKVATKLPRGLQSSLRNVVWEFRVYLLHCQGLVHAYRFRTSTNLKLNLACGKKIKEGWINIDFNKETDLSLDLRERLPFPTDSCSTIYSEHFLEHLDYPDQVTSFLKESYRILKPGGIFSVGVPDTEWPIRGYVELEKSDYFRYAKEQWHPKWCSTKLEHINYHFRQGNEHRFAYDFETLKHILEISGFVEVKRRDFNSKLDSEDRKLGTLYVDATKPIQFRIT